MSKLFAALIVVAGCAADAPRLDVRWNEPISKVTPRLLGHNAVWSRGGLGLWDETAKVVKPDVAPLVAALKPGMLRFPGGTRAMLYHFDEAIGPHRTPQCDPFTGEFDDTSYGIDEALRFAESLGAETTLVSPWHDGTPERAAAMVAYTNAMPDSTVMIGVDANGRNWGTAGEWAARRVANGHPAPYGVPMLEVGNEPYLDLPTGKTVCGTDHPYTQAERIEAGVYIPSTARDVATQVAKTVQLVKRVDPSILVGAPALTDVLGVQKDPATAISSVDQKLGNTDAWNPTMIAMSGADFLLLHIYSFGAMTDRVRLADQLRTAVTELRAIGAHDFAVTEFGTLFDAETQLNALVSLDMARVATEEHLLANLRHILIEDRPSGLFANSAAILGEDHQLMPGYHAMTALADALQPVAVSADQSDIVTLATRSESGDTLGIAITDRRLAMTPADLSIALPPGDWTGELMIESASSVTGTDVSIERTTLSASGALPVSLPANGIAIVRLSLP